MSFAWSFSKIDAFEGCPKRYYEYSVAKSVKDTDTSNMDWGNKVHDAMRDSLKFNKPLPEDMAPYQKWADRVLAGPGELFVEQKYGLTKDFSPCAYFAPIVWYRGIADAVRIWDNVGLAIDWKTGKKKDGKIQLGLMALCLFQYYPKMQVVRTEYIWLNEDDTTTEVFKRSDMPHLITELMPRVDALEWAHKNMTFPPKPSGICVRWCNVVSCPFHGRGNK